MGLYGMYIRVRLTLYSNFGQTISGDGCSSVNFIIVAIFGCLEKCNFQNWELVLYLWKNWHPFFHSRFDQTTRKLHRCWTKHEMQQNEKKIKWEIRGEYSSSSLTCVCSMGIGFALDRGKWWEPTMMTGYIWLGYAYRITSSTIVLMIKYLFWKCNYIRQMQQQQ